MAVASAIRCRIVSAALMQRTLNCVVRWQVQWLTAQGRWHCSPSLCWCAGATASRTPISTAASSQPWSSSRFWSPLSKVLGVGRELCIFGGRGTGTGLPVMIQTQHLLRMYCMKNSDTVGQKNQLHCSSRFRELDEGWINGAKLLLIFILYNGNVEHKQAFTHYLTCKL